ncbi:MAG: hypothetical protein IJC23_03975 [Bacteroidaceae bacterium]|nr:hypothetical protein [Bacteroidaceae bacterium]
MVTTAVGTRHAVSETESQKQSCGHGMPCPYNTERKQVQDRNAGLKRKSNRSPSALSRRNEVCDPSSASVIR